MRLPLPENCSRVVREMIAHGLDPDEFIEFCRDDVVCLRGKAKTFAGRRLKRRRRPARVVVLK